MDRKMASYERRLEERRAPQGVTSVWARQLPYKGCLQGKKAHKRGEPLFRKETGLLPRELAREKGPERGTPVWTGKCLLRSGLVRGKGLERDKPQFMKGVCARKGPQKRGTPSLDTQWPPTKEERLKKKKALKGAPMKESKGGAPVKTGTWPLWRELVGEKGPKRGASQSGHANGVL